MKYIMLPLAKELRAKQIKEGLVGERCPDSMAGMAGLIANTPCPNEVARRRSYWFLGGLLLMRAEEIFANDIPANQSSLEPIWEHLARCSDIVDDVLRENILWSDDEKDIGRHNRARRTENVFL